MARAFDVDVLCCPQSFESAAKLDAALGGAEIKELIAIFDRDVGGFSARLRTTFERVLLHEKT